MSRDKLAAVVLRALIESGAAERYRNVFLARGFDAAEAGCLADSDLVARAAAIAEEMEAALAAPQPSRAVPDDDDYRAVVEAINANRAGCGDDGFLEPAYVARINHRLGQHL